jgi:hypothetical protein
MSQPAGTRLLVAEQLMLLAFSLGNGRLRSSARRYLPMGVAGAVLTELAVRHSISIDPRGGCPGKHLVLGIPSRTGDPLLDSTAAQIQAQQPRTLAWWIKGLSRSGVQGQVSSRLVMNGLAVPSHGLFTTRLQLTQPAAHAGAAARVQQTLLSGPAAAAGLWATDPWSAALTSLAFGCGVVPGFVWLPRQQRGAAKMSLQAIRASDPVGVAVAMLVEQARRAQAAAASASASASSAAMIPTIMGI